MQALVANLPPTGRNFEETPVIACKKGLPRALILIITIGAAVFVQAETAKPVVLKTSVAFVTTQPGPGSTIQWIADRTELASNGSIKMRLFEPNKLASPFEILDAVSSGKVNAGYGTASHWAGKMPAATIFAAIPFGPEAGEFMAWLWYGNGMKLYQSMYDRYGYNVKVIVCGMQPPRSSGWFATKVENREDLKDLKMRIFGFGGEVMKGLGVSVHPLAVSEIIPALDSQKIEAAEFSIPVMERRLGFSKHVKYNYFPGWQQQASMMELLINKRDWNGMHESQRAFIDVVCKAATANSFAEGEATQFEPLRENVERDKVEIRYWSNEMLELFERTWQEIARQQAASDPFFKEVWEDLSNFRANYDVWRKNAFLPRRRPD